MSVINKMLRDLDQRQATVNVPDASQGTLPLGAAVPLSATRARLAPNPARSRSRTIGIVLACAALAGALAAVFGAGAWDAQRAVPVATALTHPAANVLPAGTEPVPSAPLPVVVQAPAPLPAEAPAPVAVKPTTPALAAREPATLGLRMDTQMTQRKSAERTTASNDAPKPAALAAPLLSKDPVLPKAPTPNEALERAQVLWNTGARDAAIDLLQDAVVLAQRAAGSNNAAAGNPVLLPLVRELTRMQLAEARYSAVWDSLTRLEPQLGPAADLWAIRGNVAQRLGRHQDSVHAYMVALQSRPNEQRWMLGAAVSLAALGQTSSATEMANKARAVGLISPEVQAYLRQMGVSFDDK